MRVLLLSAYDAQSHQYWRLTVEKAFPEWAWTVKALPPRHFSWRMRGNALVWFQDLAFHQGYDLILATSMVDVVALKGLCPALAQTPCALYFHENQFAYPQSDHQHSNIELQLVSVYSAMASTRMAFNSQHNFDSFFKGLDSLLRRLPDRLPAADWVRDLRDKARVLPVPLSMPILGQSKYRYRKDDGVVLHIVWNHRWEYDKGPQGLLAIIHQLPADLPIRIHVVGQRFRTCPSEMHEIKQALIARDWLGEWGYIEDRSAYLRLLAESDVVLSTARHDFQGLSVLEAMQLGCRPLLPQRLVYPEYVGPDFLYESDLDDPVREASSAAYILQQWCALDPSQLPLVPDTSRFLSSHLLPEYHRWLVATTA